MAARVSIQSYRFALRCSGQFLISSSGRGQASIHYKKCPRILAPQFSSSSGGDGTVELAYDLHSPAEPVADDRTRPILFLHGLFGSKKNNRTMSK